MSQCRSPTRPSDPTFYWIRRSGAPQLRNKTGFLWQKFPKFVLGFLAISTAATLGLFTARETADIANLSRWAFLPTVAGIGLRTNVRSVSSQGWRPLIVGTVGELAIATLTLAMVVAAASLYTF